MEKERGFRAEIGKVTYNNGFKIEARKAQDQQVHASDTALHEAKHVVAGIDDGAIVEEVSVVPGPGYLGITKFNRFSDAGAAAPHADGHNGTSWDVALIEMKGGNVISAGMRGRNSIRAKQRHVHRIAQELDVKGTLNGGEVQTIMREVEIGEEIIIDIKSQEGARKTIETRSNEPYVMISGKELTLAA